MVGFVGRHGAVSIAQVKVALGIGHTAAYRRVAGLVDAGLLERLHLLRGEPTLLRATRAGLRYAGLGVAPAVVSPGSVGHWLRCAAAGLDLEARFGAGRVLTVRELVSAERHEERPIASAVVGRLPDGRPRLHRPDLVVLPEGHPLTRIHVEEVDPAAGPHPGMWGVRPGEGDEVWAVEVELTPKSPARLREIIRAWRRAEHVDHVHYLCEPGQTRRAVERAVEKLHASGRIIVSEVAP